MVWERRSNGPVTAGIGRAKQRQGGSAYRGCQMHWARIGAQQQVAFLQNRCQSFDLGASHQIDSALPDESDAGLPMPAPRLLLRLLPERRECPPKGRVSPRTIRQTTASAGASRPHSLPGPGMPRLIPAVPKSSSAALLPLPRSTVTTRRRELISGGTGMVSSIASAICRARVWRVSVKK